MQADAKGKKPMQADAKACKRKSREVAAKGQGQAANSRQTSPKGGKGHRLGGFSVVSPSFVGVCAKALCRFWLGCRLCLLLPFTPCRRHPAFAVALPLHSARITAFLPLCIPLAFGFHPLHHPLRLWRCRGVGWRCVGCRGVGWRLCWRFGCSRGGSALLPLPPPFFSLPYPEGINFCGCTSYEMQPLFNPLSYAVYPLESDC